MISDDVQDAMIYINNLYLIILQFVYISGVIEEQAFFLRYDFIVFKIT